MSNLWFVVNNKDGKYSIPVISKSKEDARKEMRNLASELLEKLYPKKVEKIINDDCHNLITTDGEELTEMILEEFELHKGIYIFDDEITIGNAKEGETIFKIFELPENIYSNDSENNCTIIKWGESGYYNTDYPKGNYTDEVIDEMNEDLFDGDTKLAHAIRHAFVCCSMVAQSNPDLDWNKHFKICMGG